MDILCLQAFMHKRQTPDFVTGLSQLVGHIYALVPHSPQVLATTPLELAIFEQPLCARIGHKMQYQIVLLHTICNWTSVELPTSWKTRTRSSARPISHIHKTLDYKTYVIESKADLLATETRPTDTGHRAHVIQGNIIGGVQAPITAPTRTSDCGGYAMHVGIQITYEDIRNARPHLPRLRSPNQSQHARTKVSAGLGWKYHDSFLTLIGPSTSWTGTFSRARKHKNARAWWI